MLPDPDPQEIINWISMIANSHESKHIVFVGGEPFLQKNLRTYIYHASKVGLITTVVTNGYWASTEEKAEDILKSFPGLNCIIASSDIYHLEFIDKEIIYNLVRACLKLGIAITINITAASKEEGERIEKIYKHFKKDNVHIVVSPMFPWGAATKLTIEKFKYLNDLNLLPNYCEIRDHHIDSAGRVYSCCNATLGNKTGFLFLGNLKKESYDTIIANRDSNPLFNFIDRWGPQGLGKLISESPFIDELKDIEFTHSCHLCSLILNDENIYKYILKILGHKEQAKTSCIL